MITLYYVVSVDDDIRHATRHNPYTGPPRLVATLCEITVNAALPGDDRAPPRTPLPNGDNPFCPTCTWRDACLPDVVHQVLTTENWRLHAHSTTTTSRD